MSDDEFIRELRKASARHVRRKRVFMCPRADIDAYPPAQIGLAVRVAAYFSRGHFLFLEEPHE